MVTLTELPKLQKDELICSFASLILHDEKLDITSENIFKLIKAAEVNVEPYMPGLVEKALKSVNMNNLLTGSTLSSVNTGSVQAETKSEDKELNNKKEDSKKKEEVEEDENEDFGFSLFD